VRFDGAAHVIIRRGAAIKDRDDLIGESLGCAIHDDV